MKAPLHMIMTIWFWGAVSAAGNVGGASCGNAPLLPFMGGSGTLKDVTRPKLPFNMKRNPAPARGVML